MAYEAKRMLRAAWAQAHQVRRDHGVSIAAQWRSIVALRRSSGMSRAEFYRYRLWRPALTLRDRLEYTTLRERRMVEWLRNPEPHRRLLDIKTQGALRIASTGVAVPEHLAVVAAAPFAVARGVRHLTSADDFRDFLDDTPASGIVLKPEDGMEGRGIVVAVRASREGLVGVTGTVRTAGEVWRHMTVDPARVWRIEPRVAAHPAFAGYRPGTTPTVRLVTMLVDGRASAHVATVKIPRGSNEVDNFHAGNLACGVDLVTGRVGSGVNQPGTEWHAVHPECGIAIAGAVIPGWSQFLAAVEEAAPALAPLTSLGWDVAIGERGPVVLEANTSWDEDIVQMPQSRGILHGRFVDLLKVVGDGGILARRAQRHPGWDVS